MGLVDRAEERNGHARDEQSASERHAVLQRRASASEHCADGEGEEMRGLVPEPKETEPSELASR